MEGLVKSRKGMGEAALEFATGAKAVGQSETDPKLANAMNSMGKVRQCAVGGKGGGERSGWGWVRCFLPVTPIQTQTHTHTHTHTGLADNTRCRSGWRRSTPTRR